MAFYNKQVNDEYYTPEYAVVPLLKYLRPKSKILCPFDTEESNYVKVLEKSGHTVIHTHISDGKDFFKLKKCNSIDYIISNPPFSKKTEVFEHLYRLGVPFAMLMNFSGIFESKRFDLFSENKFEMLIFDKRIKFNTGSPNFPSYYFCSNFLPEQIIFERIKRF